MHAPRMTVVASALALFTCSLSSCSEPSQPETTSSMPTVDVAPNLVSGHAQMLQLLETIRQRTATDNQYLGDEGTRLARERLAELDPESNALPRLNLLVEIGERELNAGKEQVAIDLLTEAQELAANLQPTLEGEGGSTQIAFKLGVAYLRLGETENCCALNVPGSCILPITGDALHTKKPLGSTRASECFMQVLEGTATDSLEHKEALWLLNLAAMTLGKFPAEVPEKYRLPAEAFALVPGFPHFKNIAGKLGLDTFSLSGGVIADDFDGDGHIDLMVSTWDSEGQLRYFHNQGDGTFADRTDAAGLTGLFGGLNLIQADYDNDGDTDALVLRGAWLFEEGQHPNSLLRNDGGTFTDVTMVCGMGKDHYPTQTASWADYDLDGDLDLYVANESTKWITAPNQLWNNQGDGTFVDVAKAAGVEDLRFSKSTIWGDYDHDRYPDIYVSNNDSANRLYRNQGDGTFVDVAPELAVDEPISSFPAWFWDVDNDGNLDLFVSAYSGGIGHLAFSYLGNPTDAARVPRLYAGNGKGGFDSVGEKAGLVRPTLPMGSNFGDLDGDGFLDFYLGTGAPEFKNLMPNAMFMNRSGRFFMDVSTSGGFAHLQKGHGIVFADLDNDGDNDVFEQMGGTYAGDRFRDALYENPGFGNRWLAVQLVGTKSNRSAIGTRLHAVISKGDRTRSVYRHVNSGGTFGANPLRQTLGLGSAEKVDRLDVFWPMTGETQSFTGLPLDNTIRITEGRSNFEVLSLPSYTLGG